MAISFDDLIPGNNNTPGSAPAGGISFDDLIPKAAPGGAGQPPAQPEYQDSAVSIATQVPVGLNNIIATGAGFPVDAATWLLNRIPGVNIQDPVGGSGTFKKAMGLIGANPDDREARTKAERIARAAGEGIGMMVVPEAAVGLLSRAGVLGGRALETAGSLFGRSESVPSVAANAFIGGAGGATGGAAAEAVPEPYKPYAELGGNLIGGTAAALATTAPRVARDLFDLGARYIEPMTAAGRERIAGKQLSDSATSPYAVRDALEDLPREVVPGSQPTTFQLTGDMGLGALERDVATKNPADFMQRRADQNAARLDLMDGLQPKGSAADIPTLLRSSLKSLDDETQLAVNRALEGARNRTSQIGGTRAPEDYGIGLRSALQKAEDGARTRERGLWQAIDPDGTLTIDMSPVKKAASDIYGNMSKASQTGLSPLSGGERPGGWVSGC